MLYSKRIWSIVPAASAEWLAEQLNQCTWCDCTGFRLGIYVLVNDATCADGAQEYGVFREDGDHYVQIESLTFSWMTCDEAKSIIRRVVAAEFDHAKYGTVARNRLQTPDQHARCHLCA